jgi:potassium/hydrogen antiporter
MQDISSVLIAKHVLLTVAILLGAGAVSSWLAHRLRFPDLVLYLLAGILLGPQVSGYMSVPADSVLAQIALSFGASYILFDGGTGVRLEVLRRIWITVSAISTLGVLITAALVCLTAHLFLAMPWAMASLLGAVVSATDPAALIPMFKQIHVRERLAQMIICEAAFNDAVSAVLTFVLVGAGGVAADFHLSGALGSFATQAGLGILVGALLGFAAAFLMGHGRYGFLRDYAPLLTLITVIGAYHSADNFGASGYMAVFVAGVILGNRHSFGFTLSSDEDKRLHDYADTTALILRMVIFILLGSQIDLHLIGRDLWGTVGCVAVFVLVARPLAVIACALPDRRVRWTAREILFMCWTRETGVIPGALVGMLMARGVAGSDRIAAVVFAAILVTLLVQGGSTRWLARRLGLLETDAPAS